MIKRRHYHGEARNMRIALACTLLLGNFIQLFYSADAFGDRTIPCSKPPDRGAKVAVRDGVAVNYTQNSREGTCTFAIDGAKAASPRAELILSGFNALRAGAPIVDELSKGSVDNLGYAMLASAPVEEIPNDFRDYLNGNSQQLAGCLRDFFQGKDPEVILNNKGGQVGHCRAYRDGGGPGKEDAYVEISIKWQDVFVSSLFVPRIYPKLPKLSR